MMSARTFRNIRTAYYVGIAFLILNTLPASRNFMAFIADFEVVQGFTVAIIIAILVAIGAYMAYRRKL